MLFDGSVAPPVPGPRNSSSRATILTAADVDSRGGAATARGRQRTEASPSPPATSLRLQSVLASLRRVQAQVVECRSEYDEARSRRDELEVANAALREETCVLKCQYNKTSQMLEDRLRQHSALLQQWDQSKEQATALARRSQRQEARLKEAQRRLCELGQPMTPDSSCEPGGANEAVCPPKTPGLSASRRLSPRGFRWVADQSNLEMDDDGSPAATRPDDSPGTPRMSVVSTPRPSPQEDDKGSPDGGRGAQAPHLCNPWRSGSPASQRSERTVSPTPVASRSEMPTNALSSN